MYFKVLIETGYSRDGTPFEITRHVEAENTVLLFDRLKEIPGLDNKSIGYAVTTVKSISKREFDKGREDEKNDPRRLRVHARYVVVEKCIIEPSSPDVSFTDIFQSETIDMSAGGAGIKTFGRRLKMGDVVKLTIKKLEMSGKDAEVVWVREADGEFSAGLRWIN